MKKLKIISLLAGMLLLCSACSGNPLPFQNDEVLPVTQTAARTEPAETEPEPQKTGEASSKTEAEQTKQTEQTAHSETAQTELQTAEAAESETAAPVQTPAPKSGGAERETAAAAFALAELPAYDGTPYCEVNGNVPFFTAADLAAEPSASYSELDALGRCGVCFACIVPEMMPTEPRESIGAVKPSGWHLIRYDDLIEGKYLYNRCHLIAFMLTGENANERNLITGTRYLNTEGMLPFETKTADYIRRSGKRVLYRVTPIFSGDNLLADGVLMEAMSAEDGGSGLQFCVFCCNVQPQIAIDYETGDSQRIGEEPEETEPLTREMPWLIPEDESSEKPPEADYILNTNTKRFHYPDCKSVPDIKEKNKESFTGDRETLIAEGYVPCGRCKP